MDFVLKVGYIFVAVKLPEPVHPELIPTSVHVPVMVLFVTVPCNVNVSPLRVTRFDRELKCYRYAANEIAIQNERGCLGFARDEARAGGRECEIRHANGGTTHLGKASREG